MSHKPYATQILCGGASDAPLTLPWRAPPTGAFRLDPVPRTFGQFGRQLRDVREPLESDVDGVEGDQERAAGEQVPRQNRGRAGPDRAEDRRERE